MAAVGQVNDRDSRWYVDPEDPTRIFESVTTVIGATESKSWLADWGGKTAAEWAADHHDLIGTTLEEADRDAAVDLIKGASRRIRDAARERGTIVHDVTEALVLGSPLPGWDHLPPDEQIVVEELVDGYLNFVSDLDVRFVLAEATVANVTHSYAGTLDAIATLRCLDRTLLIDTKTGQLNPRMAAQLAAYESADEVWLPFGRKAPMPRLDGAAVLHLSPDYDRGYKLLQVDTGPVAFAWFRQMLELFRADRAAKFVRRPLYPPLPDGTQPPLLLEDVEGLRCRGRLMAAGHRTLADVASLTAADLRAMDGIGPKAVEAVHMLLADHGLHLADETPSRVAS